MYLLFVYGEIGDGRDVLVRLHSACLTGDAFGSLRCDCGPQLQLAVRRIVAEGRGALVYAAGHEGRGVRFGLMPKLRAYMLQDKGYDTVEANRRLGLPVDGRDFREAVQILQAAGIEAPACSPTTPRQGQGVGRGRHRCRAPGVAADRTAPSQPPVCADQATAARPPGPGRALLTGNGSLDDDGQAFDATALLGKVDPLIDRPYVVLKYAQTLDGRIARQRLEIPKWISGTQERRVSHAPGGLRRGDGRSGHGAGRRPAADRADGSLGASPIRVVLDSTLRVPPDAQVFGARPRRGHHRPHIGAVRLRPGGRPCASTG